MKPPYHLIRALPALLGFCLLAAPVADAEPAPQKTNTSKSIRKKGKKKRSKKVSSPKRKALKTLFITPEQREEARKKLAEQGITESAYLQQFDRLSDNDLAQVLLFIQAGMDVNALHPAGRSILYDALVNGYAGVAKLLLKAPTLRLRDKDHILSNAALCEDEELIRMILEHPDTKTEHVTEALNQAVLLNHAGITRILLQAGAVPTNEVFEDAAYSGARECAQLMIKSPQFNPRQIHPDVLGIVSGNAEAYLRLANEGDVNRAIKISYNEYTLLSWAAYMGYEDCVHALLKIKGIDVNTPNKDGKSALNVTTKEEIKELLIAAGAKE